MLFNLNVSNNAKIPTVEEKKLKISFLNSPKRVIEKK